MNELYKIDDLTKVWLINYLILSLRYLFFAGIAYLIIWKWKKNKLIHLKIQKNFPEPKKIRAEVLYSFLTFGIFALSGVLVFILKQKGLTKIYLEIDKMGIPYLIFSIFLFIILHDMYFYFTHRMMHHKLLFKYFHKVHHNSTDPSPWASFSFHPLEAVVEAGIVPLLVVLIPAHPITIISFLMYMTFMNVLGHLGFELFPKGSTKHWFGKWSNTTTHHNMHHKYFNSNYGLYFNFWDRIMNTNHVEYFNTFDEVTNRKKIV